MKKFLQKLLIIVTTLVIVVQPLLYLSEVRAEDDAAPETPDIVNATDSINGDDPGGDPGVNSGRVTDPIQEAAASLETYGYDNSNTLTQGSPENQLSKINNLSTTISKLVLNQGDLQDLRTLSCLGDSIPDFASYPESLASATGKYVEEILMLKSEHPEQWQDLVKQAQETARQNIVANLKTDVKNFACIAGVDETMAADMLAHDQESVSAIIDYAKDKVVIDRRVLLLLTNLVTPKNENGAGHDRIRVLRIRNGYDRDARSLSRESDAIRDAINQKAQAQAETVADVSASSRDDLSSNPEFQSSEAQASVISSTGTNQGDLIFNTNESDVNLSAHAKGEAIDVSEIDNMKCTLIKRRRLGGSTLVPQPPTPIKVAWQTSEGYDTSPPPDYSSLSMNLRQMASGQYFDLLNELGIDPNTEDDLSSASFGDVASLIGESLLAEILNSPTNSLQGYSLTDTVKMIGGMILADKLGLPRQAFIDADLASLSDLESKIGEAVLEKKLNLYYGSIRGNNLAEILSNIGLRHVEKQIGVPVGTISAGLSGPDLKLAIGRRYFESKLHIQSGTLTSDTNYKKLRDKAGSRKIDLLFTNPAEVDDTLGIDFHYSEDYKSGRISADQYATAIGEKLLYDRAYIFAYTASAANALNLNPVSAAGEQGLPVTDNDRPTSMSNTALNSATAIAQARFNWITSGQMTAQNGVVPPATFSLVYQGLGAEVLASALSSNTETRLALVSWMGTNAIPNSGQCAISDRIVVTIPKYGSTTGETISVTIPEDQFMASYGLRRGDFARLFGCYKSTPIAVFRGLGESELYNAVRTSSMAQQAQARFLADHPEIANFLNDIEFYRTRIETIKSNITTIKNDWGSASSGQADMQNLVSQINGDLDQITTAVESINTSNLTSIGSSSIVRTIRSIPTMTDQILTYINTIQNGSDQSLRDRANRTLINITTVIHAIDEILSGAVQPELETIQINDININGSGSSSRNSSGTVNNNSGKTLNRANLVLMLSGKLSPKDYLISIGSNQIESTLNLPNNSILYFAKYLVSSSKKDTDLKNAFFRSIGQAQLEETFGMPPFFFQGDNPGGEATLTDVKIHIANTFHVSESEAGARIMQALNLPGNFSEIERRSVILDSSVLAAAKNIDSKLGIEDNTTAKFLNNEPLNKGSIGNSDIRMLAGALNIPEEAISTFMQVKQGRESLSDAHQNTLNRLISYNSHNEFATQANPVSPSSPVNSCPIGIHLDPTTHKLVSTFFEDNSYIYTSRAGTVSTPNLQEAKNYATNVPADQQVDFSQAISIGVLKAKGNANPSDDQVNKASTDLNKFLQDTNDDELYSDPELNDLADMLGVPIDTLIEFFQRPDVKDKAKYAASKPINAYLELIGQKTAERRIVSTLLGSLAVTFGGLRVDATDIFDILSGNSRQVLYRIGSRYLENQLNIPQNVIMRALEAPTKFLRDCSLTNIGSNLLGTALGVGSVSLTGNIYNNIGAARIEQALGLPQGSFRGQSIDDLISYIGAPKFADVFSLPPDVVTPVSITNSLLDSAGAASLALQSYSQRSHRIDNLLGGEESIGYTTPNILDAASSSVDQLVRSFVHDATNYQAISGTDNRTIQIQRFQMRIRQIDPMIGLTLGSTEKMFRDTLGYKPDDLVRAAAGNVLAINGPNILSALGLSTEAAGIVATVINTPKIVDTIKSCGSGHAVNGSTCDRGFLFGQLQQLFGINFDAKLGLPNGTISAIIENPKLAAYKLISGALTRLDGSLGLVDEHGNPYADASFSAAFGVWACDRDVSTCQSNNQTFPNMTHHNGILPIGYPGLQVIAHNMANHFVGDWLNRIGIIEVGNQSGSTYPGFPNTEALLRSSADMLLHGDLRVLAISAGVKALEALHLYNDSSSANLPDPFRISFEDVYYAVMGNPIMEQQYSNSITNNFAFWYDKGITTDPPHLFTNDSEMTNGTNPLYASQCYPGAASSASCANANLLNFAYSYYDNADSFANSANNYVAGTPADLNATLQRIAADPVASQELAKAQEYAVSQARSDNRNNLMWRMADAKLYQLDSNIPLGFARTMFSGTGRQKTMMLLLYAANAFNLSDIKIGGVSLGEISTYLPVAQGVIDFFKNPGAFDLDTFYKSGNLARLDTWISGRFSNFLGFDLPAGTFTSLFYGLKNNNFSDNIPANGARPEIVSIKNLAIDWGISKITAWADKALGLPSGTVYTAYKMYQSIQAARAGVTAASFAIANAQQAVNAATSLEDAAALAKANADLAKANTQMGDAKASITQLKAELISFIITTLFAKQIAAVEQALGLVPGTGAILVSAAVSFLMTGAIPWIGIAMFIVMNLFGVYKVDLWCTADGYYPKKENPPDQSVSDNGNLGIFDGMENNARKQGYIDAARYKTRTVIGDTLMLGEKIGDKTAVPSQIMTGRQEDADYWQYKVDEVICSKIGGCAGTRAGIWANPQTTSYIHIGF